MTSHNASKTFAKSVAALFLVSLLSASALTARTPILGVPEEPDRTPILGVPGEPDRTPILGVPGETDRAPILGVPGETD